MEDDSPVRAALDSFRALPPRTVPPGPRQPLVPVSDPLGPAGFLAFLLATVVVVVLAVTVSARNTTARACPTITYSFAGDPPEQVRSEFVTATEEVSRMTGLRFAPSSDGTDGTLNVAWVPNVHAAADQASSTRAHSTVVGSGFGRWHREGIYRVLDGAAIKINARWDWFRTSPTGDSLRSVLIHELGHVVGLSHSADPASFMYSLTRATPQLWTADDQRQLKAIGKNAGCS
jgi:hypothetical protein